MIRTLCELFGALLVFWGLALVAVPLALIVAGVTICAVSYVTEGDAA